jgi:4-hydroxybenzoate polyprenyltransferase
MGKDKIVITIEESAILYWFVKGSKRLNKFLTNIYYSTRAPHFFLAAGATMLGWGVTTTLIGGFDPVTFYYSMKSTVLAFAGEVPAALFFSPTHLGVHKAMAAAISNGFCFTFILMFNDYCDLEADRKGKKKNTLLTRGEITKSEQLAGVLTLMAVCLAISIFLVRNLFFLLLTLVSFLGGWAYSAKPTQIKKRAGLDIFWNGLYTWLLPVSGAVLVVNSLSQMHHLLFMLCAIFGMYFFMIGALMDLEDDKKHGINTIAVRLGFKKSIILNMALAFGFIIIIGIMAYSNYLITFRWFLYIILPVYLLGSSVVYIGLFKHIFHLKTGRITSDPAHFRKFYKWAFMGHALQTLPLALSFIDYLIVDFVPL